MSSNGIILQNQSGWICHSLTSGVVNRNATWCRLGSDWWKRLHFTALCSLSYWLLCIFHRCQRLTSSQNSMKMWLKQITVYPQPQNTLSRGRMHEELWENRSKQRRWLRLPRCYLELWVAIQFIDWTATPANHMRGKRDLKPLLAHNQHPTDGVTVEHRSHTVDRDKVRWCCFDLSYIGDMQQVHDENVNSDFIFFSCVQ